MNDRLALSTIAVVSVLVVVVVGILTLAPKPPVGREAPAFLPTLNAALNGTAALLLAAGYVLIRRRQVAAHRAAMLGAFGVSALFLVSYVVYHAQAGSRPFEGEGWIRPVYFAVLISHIVLAALIVPFVLATIYRAWRGEFGRHVRIARWTLPAWLYVSVTGVLVYWMLYHLAGGP